MMKIIVSVISEQSVPNMVMIKNNQDADKFVNIVTKKSKAYLDNFKEALKKSIPDIDDKSVVIDVDETKSSDILKKLEYKGNIFDEAEKIFVNITGGTKILSIFTYQFFNMNYKDKSRFFYMDIGKSAASFIELPKDTDVPMEPSNNISLEEYMRSYGINIIETDSLMFNYNYARVILNKFTSVRYARVRSLLNCVDNILCNEIDENIEFNLRNIFLNIEISDNKKRSDLCKVKGNIDKICDYIDTIHETLPNIPDSSNISIKYIKYIVSKFLEEYLYYFIKEKIFNNKDYDVYLKTGVKINYIYKNKSDDKDSVIKQELDIIFIFNNVLCYIECKTFVGNAKLLNEAVFKQSAITAKKLGLRTPSFFVHLDNYYGDQGYDRLKIRSEKAGDYNISLITRNELYNGEFLKKIKNALKLP